ncbi:AAA family ATPase [Spiroplasma endosymbiont of Labia minor]|uniref:ParA family protein n=1 Tax=Spiroplasma endosymbiont of Labia minor TaxID=3066305 RepID=UPI0030D07E84
MGKIIAVVNQKGGVGKTTTAISLACGMGMKEQKILLIDLDPQYNATTGLSIEVNRKTLSMYNVLIGEKNIEDIIMKNVKHNVDVAPSSIDLAAADLFLLEQKQNNQDILKQQLIKIKNNYDFIIIDCPPSLGLINRNGLSAADTVLIPIQAEHFAMYGVSQLLRTITKVKETLNPKLTIEGVIVTMFDQRTLLSNDVLAEIKKSFKDRAYKAVIPRNIRIAESSMEGKSIFEHDPNGAGAKSYWELVNEVMTHNGK